MGLPYSKWTQITFRRDTGNPPFPRSLRSFQATVKEDRTLCTATAEAFVSVNRHWEFRPFAPFYPRLSCPMCRSIFSLSLCLSLSTCFVAPIESSVASGGGSVGSKAWIGEFWMTVRRVQSQRSVCMRRALAVLKTCPVTCNSLVLFLAFCCCCF